MRILKTLFRRYVDSAQLDSTVEFYESLQGMPCKRRLSFREMGIEGAVIGAGEPGRGPALSAGCRVLLGILHAFRRTLAPASLARR